MTRGRGRAERAHEQCAAHETHIIDNTERTNIMNVLITNSSGTVTRSYKLSDYLEDVKETFDDVDEGYTDEQLIDFATSDLVSDVQKGVELQRRDDANERAKARQEDADVAAEEARS